MISASPAPAADLTVDLTAGGTARPAERGHPTDLGVLPAGAMQTAVTVQTRSTTTVQTGTTISLSIASGTGYVVGSPGTAQTTIQNNAVPTLQITGGTTVSPEARPR